jgi:hypothetical protein
VSGLAFAHGSPGAVKSCGDETGTDKTCSRIPEFLVRRARLQRVEVDMARRFLVGYLETVYV